MGQLARPNQLASANGCYMQGSAPLVNRPPGFSSNSSPVQTLHIIEKRRAQSKTGPSRPHAWAGRHARAPSPTPSSDPEPEPEPEPEPTPPKPNKWPHIAILRQLRITNQSPGKLAVSLRTWSRAPEHICTGTGLGADFGLSLDAGVMGYRDWAELTEVEEGKSCRWVLGTREGHLVVTFLVGKVPRAVVWAPYVGEVYGEGTCVWQEKEEEEACA